MASAIAPLAVGFLANKVVSQVTGNSKLGAIAGLAAGGLTGMGGLTGGSSGILGAGASQAAPAFGGTAATAAGANASGNFLTNAIGKQFPLSDFGASAAGSAIKSSVAPNLSSAMFGGAGSPHAGMSAATPMNPAEFMGFGGPQYGSPNPQAGIPVQPGLTAGNSMPADMFQTGFGEAGRGGFTGAQNMSYNPYIDGTPSSMYEMGDAISPYMDPTPASMYEMGEPQLMFPTNSPISSIPQSTANVSIPQSMGNVPAQAPAPAPAPAQQWNPADYAPDDMMTYGSDMSQPAPAQSTGMDQRYRVKPEVRTPETIGNPTGQPQNMNEFNLDNALQDFSLNDLSGASVDNTPLIGVGTEVNGASGSTYSPTPDYNPAAVDQQVMGAGAPPAPVQAPSGAMGEAGRTLPLAQNTSPNPYVDGTPSSMFDYDSIEPATAASNIQRSYNMFGDDVSAGAAADTTLLAQSSEAAQAVASQLSDQDNIQNSVKAFGKKALDWLKENPDMIKFLGAAALSLLAKKKEEEKGGGGGGVQFGPMASAYAGTSGGGGGQAPLGFGLAQRKGYTPQAI